MGWDKAIPEPPSNPSPVLKKKSQTHLLNLNLIPLGARRGGYPKEPGLLPSLLGNEKMFRKICIYLLWKKKVIVKTVYLNNIHLFK